MRTVAALAAVLLFLIVGCGGSSTQPSDTQPSPLTTTKPSADAETKTYEDVEPDSAPVEEHVPVGTPGYDEVREPDYDKIAEAELQAQIAEACAKDSSGPIC